MATYYFRNISNSWNTASNWSLTSGGGATGAVPTSADDVIFNSSSFATCNIDVSGATCNSVTINGWGGAMTVTNNLTVVSGWSATSGGTTVNSPGTVFVGGTINVSAGHTQGTGTLEMNGTGTISGVFLISNIVFNTAGTITIGSFALNAGKLKYTAGTMALAGSTLTINGTCTLDTIGITWNIIHVAFTSVVTLTTDLTATSLTFPVSAVTATFNNSNFIIGSLNIQNGTTILGSSKLVFSTGGGVITITGVSGVIRSNVDFNANLNFVSSSGNATLNFGATTSGTQSVVRLSGTITVNPAVTFLINTLSSATTNLDLAGISFTNFAINANGTNNLLSDITCVNVDWGVSANCITNGSVIYCSGNSTMTNNITSAGTTTLRMVGTGILRADGAAGLYNRPIIIDTLGTITFGITLRIKGVTASFKYIAGTVVPGTNAVNIGSGCVLDSVGMSWYNLVADGGTVTINSALTCATMTVNATSTFAGSDGFTALNFSCPIAGITVNFTAGRTYLVTGNLIVSGIAVNKITFSSTSTGAFFNLQVGATHSVNHCNATWINSAGGQTIFTSIGSTLSNTTNWNYKRPGNFLPFFP